MFIQASSNWVSEVSEPHTDEYNRALRCIDRYIDIHMYCLEKCVALCLRKVSRIA